MQRVLALVVVVLACTNPRSNELPPEAWGVSDYATAGIQIDGPWAAADFTKATEVLQQVTAGHRERLPRYRGVKSGAVFAKLVEPSPPDPARSVAEQFQAHFARYEAANQASKLYYGGNLLAAPPREWIELMGLLLQEASRLAELAEPFLSSFGPDDPKREVRLGGLAKMKRGFGDVLLGGLIAGGDTRMPAADRIALVKHVTAALPVLFPFAPAATQTQIRAQVERLVDDLPEGELRDAALAAQRALRP